MRDRAAFPSAYFLVYLMYGICVLLSVLLPREYEYDFMRAVGIFLPQLAFGEAWFVVEHTALCVPAIYALIAFPFLKLPHKSRRLWLLLPLCVGLLNAAGLILLAAVQNGILTIPAMIAAPVLLAIWFGQNVRLLRRAKTVATETEDTTA